MQYHYWIIRLFLPLVGQSPISVTPPVTGTKETPREIVGYSQAMFETLLRLYYLRHSYKSYDSWIIHFLLVLGSNALKSLYSATPTTQQSINILRSSVLLAASGLRQQGKSVYLAQLCALGLQKSMRPEDLRWVQQFLSLEPVTRKEQMMIDETARCMYPIPIVRADGELVTQKLGEIVTEIEELSAEEEYTDDD
jgi:hypothetical protein